MAGVLKTISRKILGKACFRYEYLTTVLCEVESVINSRPLTYISKDPEDLKPLTPSCFLRDIREYGIPDCDMLYHSKLNKKFRYKQKVINQLRARFRTEYLGQLLTKNDKAKETRAIKIGDIVLSGDDIHKRIDWPLARVIDVILGKDGKARVLISKTKNGVIKRAVQRVYPLEIP